MNQLNDRPQYLETKTRKSLVGMRFGKWTVLEYRKNENSPKNSYWLCRCDCGSEKEVARTSLRNGCSNSCGCLNHPPFKERISSNIDIDENGCWNWKGCLSRGYGRIYYVDRYTQLHRATYLHYKGKIPKGKLVCHACDNPKCCNPDHLWLGTFSDNAKDMMDKNRHPKNKGNLHGMSTFIEDQVVDLRKKYDGSISIRKFAKQENLPYEGVYKIIARKRWLHI